MILKKKPQLLDRFYENSPAGGYLARNRYFIGHRWLQVIESYTTVTYRQMLGSLILDSCYREGLHLCHLSACQIVSGFYVAHV